MPEGRDPIPADVQRAVLTESCHCCAVCGASSPLELAHIVPWSIVKSHCTENLICLCANCHSRADKEKWGRKTLEYYKLHPWAMKRSCLVDAIADRRGVTVKIKDLDLPDFNPRLRRLFIYGLACFLEIPPESIEIVEDEDGSVIVTIELPETDAQRLREAIEAKDKRFEALLNMFGKPKTEAAAKERVLDLCDRAAKLRDMANYETACDYFLTALELIRSVKDIKMEASVCCNTGNAYEKMGMSQRAIEYHTRALEIEQSLSDEDAVAFHLANLGASYFSIRDFAEAKRLFLRSKEIYQKLGSTERDTFIDWYLKRL